MATLVQLAITFPAVALTFLVAKCIRHGRFYTKLVYGTDDGANK